MSEAPPDQPREPREERRSREDDRDHRRSRHDDDRHRDYDRDRRRDYDDRDRDRDRRDRHRDRDRDDDKRRDRYRDDRDRRSFRDRDRDERPPREERSREERPPRDAPRERKPHKSRREWQSAAWDRAAPGYEHLTPGVYKELVATGTLPPPREGNASFGGSDMMMNTIHNPLTRQARRIYVDAIPEGVTNDEVQEFFNSQMVTNGMTTNPGLPIISAQISEDKSFAILEIRSVEEATNCMGLSNTSFKGATLTMRRPKDYQAPIPGGFSGGGPDTIYVSGLPSEITEEQLRELLAAFGDIKMLNFIKDSDGKCKGFIFVEFEDASSTDAIIEALKEVEFGDANLVAQRAASATTASGPGPVEIKKTRVLVLMNMVEAEELKDDEEYEDIVQDIREECEKFGKIEDMKIPRPEGDNLEAPGVGKIYIKYHELEGADKAGSTLSGRKFANRVVVVSFLSEKQYEDNEFD